MNFDFQNIADDFAYGDGACPSCGGSQLSALTDPKGNSWRFAYDKYGRLTGATNPLGQAKTYDYDKMSRVTEVKDPAGSVTAYTYDALNRLTRKAVTAASGARSITDYTYDAVGNLLNIANGGSAVSYTYDALNRPVATTQAFGGKAYTINYAYDAVGNRTGMATPWGKYSYTYDALNRLSSLVNPQNITVAFSYDAVGRRTSKKIFRTTPELLTEAVYTYDAAGQLLSITNKAGGKAVAFARYEYDGAGNRVVREDQEGATRYGYDAANRLITAEPVPFDMGKAEGFVYDRNGNRRFDRAAKDYKYDAANRVFNNSVYTYTHDQNGNLTGRTEISGGATITYAYNPEQQLSEVVTPKDKLAYKYDPLGRRTVRTVNSNTVNYVYDGQDIIAELNEAGTPINTYTNGPGIDEPLIMSKPDGKNYYYHADALGSITAITDGNRKLVETYTYKSYGQPTIKDAKGQAIPTSKIGNLRRFAAREYEPETNLYFNRIRYWDSSRGAFTQEDVIGFKGGINLYSYIRGNPLNSIDPLGLSDLISFGREISPGNHPKSTCNNNESGFGDFFGGTAENLLESVNPLFKGSGWVGAINSFGGASVNRPFILGAASEGVVRGLGYGAIIIDGMTMVIPAGTEIWNNNGLSIGKKLVYTGGILGVAGIAGGLQAGTAALAVSIGGTGVGLVPAVMIGTATGMGIGKGESVAIEYILEKSRVN